MSRPVDPRASRPFPRPSFLDRFRPRRTIDGILRHHLGDLTDLSVHSHGVPLFNMVDLFRAVESLRKESGAWAFVETEHPLDLSTILTRIFSKPSEAWIRAPWRMQRPDGPSSHTYIPRDSFWITPPHDLLLPGGVIRLRRAYKLVVLEVASRDPHQAMALIELILDRAGEHSIYKGHLLDLVIDQEESVLDVRFRPGMAVNEDEIVLTENTRHILERVLIDFHERHDSLARLGVPARRGVLLYGPPGTGKSFTCRYLASRLSSVTTVAAAGTAIRHVRQLCRLARDLQPALVILEDVDLAFPDRRLVSSSTLLGDLMDELDGFTPDDRVLFVLTTNSLERVESAIRDRPGRISQCVHFELPDADLREDLLALLLRDRDLSELDLDRLVELTDGVTQAFLKELTYRALQIASARNDWSPSPTLTTDDFEEALVEMRQAGGTSGDRILGFRTEAETTAPLQSRARRNPTPW